MNEFELLKSEYSKAALAGGFRYSWLVAAEGGYRDLVTDETLAVDGLPADASVGWMTGLVPDGAVWRPATQPLPFPAAVGAAYLEMARTKAGRENLPFHEASMRLALAADIADTPCAD